MVKLVKVDAGEVVRTKMESNSLFNQKGRELSLDCLILVFGGDVLSNTVYKFNIFTNTWSSGTPMTSPRCLFASASHNESVS